MGKRVGDTLIEVTLAVGIFSLVAIGVVAVMSGGTSSAQTSLEATLAREEIDTQAEALRFIQSSYIADKDSGIDNNYYANLWAEITGYAVTIDDSNAAYISGTPSSCAESYKSDIFSNNAFIIDPRNLGSEDVDKTIVTAESFGPDGQPILTQSTTYPRLIYNSAQLNNQDSLVTSNTANNLYRAEGIYVIAVADNETTSITDADNTSTTNKYAAFYDFYIRSCWYGTGDETPSTIATVIRLYDPGAISTAARATGVWLDFDPSNRSNQTDSQGNTPSKFVPVGDKVQLTNGFTRDGYTFVGWSADSNSTPTDVRNGKSGTYKGEAMYEAPKILSFNDRFTLYAVWQTDYYLRYDTGWNGWSGPADTECDKNKGCRIATADAPSRPGYKFKGWCLNLKNDGTCSGTVYEKGSQYPGGLTNEYTVLHAVWVPYYTVIYYNTNGTTKLCSAGQEGNNNFRVNCNRTPTNPGNGETFQGWSPNDREPFYKNGDTITVANSGDRTLKLYPVWRVSVKFSSEGWTKTPSTAASSDSSCYITNYYVENGVIKSKRVASSSGEHVQILDQGIINLQGYCRNPANESVSYTVGKNDTFELSAKMSTSGMTTHPGGYASISIGPVAATINSNNITSTCQSSAGSSYSFANGKDINLKIEKHGNEYSVAVNDTILKSCTVNTTSNVQVKYSMVHYDHSCSTVFNVQLTDIDMQRYIKN